MEDRNGRNRIDTASESQDMKPPAARSVSIGLALFVSVVSGSWVRGQGIVLERPFVEGGGGIPGAVSAVHLRAEARSRLASLAPGATVTLTGVPMGDRVGDLHLERFTLFTPDAVLLEGDRVTSGPDAALFRGRLAHGAGSRAYLGVSSTGVHGFVVDGGRTWLIASAPPGVGDEESPIAIYAVDRLPDFLARVHVPTCGGGLEAPVSSAAWGSAPDGGPENLPCRTVRVAIETDYELRQYLGSTAAVSNYVTILMGAVSEIYQYEVNTSFTIPFLRTWEENNDPYSSTTVNDRLTEFRTHWNANMSSVSRTIAHFITGIRSGAGGVAWMGSFCNSYAYGCSGHINGSFPYPLRHNHSQNWDLMVVAHEIGHNFNAPHTHSMTPPIDGCGSGDCSQASSGTIMSYCHTCSGGMRNIALHLHQRIIDERILPFLGGISTGCVARVNPPAIVTHPNPLTRREGQSASFAGSATGPSLSYQWRRDGVALTNDARVSGANTPILTIQSLTRADAGVYDLVVSNSCSSAVSDPATLTVHCRADWNLDGVIDFNDFLMFLGDYNAGNPAADLNGDGTIDFNDLLGYLNLYNTPC
jgi:hypothetical protein